MLNLKVFGQAFQRERLKSSYSLANFAKHTGGLSKEDIRQIEAGEKAPPKLAIKKIVHCFPILMQFENDLRHGNFEEPRSEVRQAKPKRARTPEPTRLPPPPKRVCMAPQAAPRKAKLEIVRQNQLPPPVLTTPLAAPLTQALRKTRPEMLSELTATVKKRLGNHTAEDYDFTIKNDGNALIVKLQVSEGKMDEDGELELVDSGCYITVSARGSGLGVFCKTMTSGNVSDTLPRMDGVLELVQIAKVLHEAVKDRRFDD